LSVTRLTGGRIRPTVIFLTEAGKMVIATVVLMGELALGMLVGNLLRWRPPA
jgi:hypothetical protein